MATLSSTEAPTPGGIPRSTLHSLFSFHLHRAPVTDLCRRHCNTVRSFVPVSVFGACSYLFLFLCLLLVLSLFWLCLCPFLRQICSCLFPLVLSVPVPLCDTWFCLSPGFSISILTASVIGLCCHLFLSLYLSLFVILVSSGLVPV